MINTVIHMEIHCDVLVEANVACLYIDYNFTTTKLNLLDQLGCF